jgi:hypothetical protein
VSAELIDAATATARAIEVAESTKAALVSRRSSLAAERDQAIADINIAVADEQRAAGRRLLDGEEAAPSDPKRKAKIAALREKWDASDAAIKLLDDRIADAGKVVADARRAHIPNVLAVCLRDKTDALNSIRDALAKATPAIVALIAAQSVQDELIGERLVMSPTVDPASLYHGSRAVAQLIAGTPERFRPNSWDLATLEPDAAQIAAARTSQINGRK